MNVEISVQDYIKNFCVYPNFPKEGVDFIDIFPLIRQMGLSKFKGWLNGRIQPNDIILLPESRAFIFASLIDLDKVVFLRKEGKRPGPTVSINAKKEYGENTFVFLPSDFKQIQAKIGRSSIQNLVLVDDVVATGNTAADIAEFFEHYKMDGTQFSLRKVLSFILLKDVYNCDLGLDIDSFITY